MEVVSRQEMEFSVTCNGKGMFNVHRKRGGRGHPLNREPRLPSFPERHTVVCNVPEDPGIDTHDCGRDRNSHLCTPTVGLQCCITGLPSGCHPVIRYPMSYTR